jgi:hypothetical protein
VCENGSRSGQGRGAKRRKHQGEYRRPAGYEQGEGARSLPADTPRTDASGTFAFIANGESTNELAYDPHTNTLSNAKEPVAAPYAIVRLMCETTRAGQSGPRVYVRSEAGQYGAPQIAGVHAYGEGSTPGAIGLANSGVWIDADMLTKILAWSGK